ncbi:cobyric acid synthase CobQ [Oribacterium sp. C9]|uniref:cobyric acid synthase n=1 Tax=Oribacterium sp. C9 TaxID=1943579 RepID=UPI00098F016D|nr:cobyric acid synthase [Oribacterium sp. C9]OON86975.1 cobyric acid synthase CobQ [Oribacterium sp. C9]
MEKKRAKAIMIQGTMSNAGKSLIAAGLCRIFHQDGYRVAPFKSQNMALNSFITEEGLEMGRAQVVQAEAAGIKPSVLMNPILLKPTTDVGSQVIINGKVSSNMTAREYYKHKKQLIPVVREAYEKLSADYDIIVIEGAGSPAEVNLRDDDIVNMGMAELTDAPVLLVGDIDRGGVFAQLYGTIELLEDHEKARIKGLIINKFRGDKTILDPGLDILRDRTGKEILGVVPYMDVVIDDEDSLSEQLNVRRYKGSESFVPLLDIAVIRLPRISNFTDFTALSTESGVSLRYVTKVRELGEPDLIILPGTKSTIKDMEWLRATGLEAKIRQKHHAGTMIMGICGGYQMLGESIVDEFGAETASGTTTRGLGFLPLVTEFSEEKTRTRVTTELSGLSGEFSKLNGQTVTGYEIHMGRTHAVCSEDSANVSAGNVFGTYIHGFFDSDELREAFLRILFEKKGINRDNITEIRYEDFKEEQYDKLASVLRESLDMNKVYRIMGLEK